MEAVVFLAVAAVTATVIGLVGGLPDPRKVKRELASKHLQSIASLADGKPAAIQGEVALVDRTHIVAPLTNRQCVYWLVVFDEVGVGGDFRELGRAEEGTSFLLRGESGTARVVPDRPRIALPGITSSRPVLDTTQDKFGLLAQRVCKRKANWPTSWLRATEYALEVGAQVRVSGWCTREPDPEAADAVSGYREQLPTRPVISGTRRAKLLIG